MQNKFKSILAYKFLLITSVLYVIFKIVYIYFFHNNFETFEDYRIAHNIVYNHQFAEFQQLGETAYKLPIYPLFLSFFIWLFKNDSLLAIAIFQSLLSFFAPLLIFKILKIFKKENTGIIAGYLYLLSPAYFLYSGIIEATNIFICVFLFWLYLYFKIWFLSQFENKRLILFGIVTSVLFLTQVVIIPMSCIMIFSLLIFKKISFKNFLQVLLLSLLFYSPWVIRNYITFNKVVITKTPKWQNIYYGFTEQGQMLEDIRLIPLDRHQYIDQKRTYTDEFEMEDIYKNEVIKVTRNEPIFFIKKSVGNLLSLWYVPPRYFDNNSMMVLLCRKTYVIILNILTLISLIIFYKKYKKLFWFSLLFFANFSFPYIIGHSANMRFKLDFEWYQLILTAFVVTEFIKYWQTKNVSKF